MLLSYLFLFKPVTIILLWWKVPECIQISFSFLAGNEGFCVYPGVRAFACQCIDMQNHKEKKTTEYFSDSFSFSGLLHNAENLFHYRIINPIDFHSLFPFWSLFHNTNERSVIYIRNIYLLFSVMTAKISQASSWVVLLLPHAWGLFWCSFFFFVCLCLSQPKSTLETGKFTKLENLIKKYFIFILCRNLFYTCNWALYPVHWCRNWSES